MRANRTAMAIPAALALCALMAVCAARAVEATGGTAARYMLVAGGGGGGGDVADPASVKGGAGIVVVRYLSDELMNLTATNVLDTSAWLNGSLGSSGAVPYAVWVYWDTNNWTTNKTWANSHEFGGEQLATGVTWQATDLTPNTVYYFTHYASNAMGELWAEPSESLRTWGPPGVDNAGGATNIGIKRATLQGRLLDAIGAYAAIYWWTNGASASNSANMGWIAEGQSFSTQVVALLSDMPYLYRCFVSNAYGTAWSEVETFTTPAFDGSYYVATNGPAGGSGNSWAQALTNLQAAIDQASPGDTIRLAAHTLANSTPQSGSQYVWANKPLTILGGYAADTNAPDALTNRPTVLTRGAASARILYVSGLTSGTLERVTLAGGYGYRAYGMGLYVAASSNLTIGTCVVTNNYTYTDNNPGGTLAAGAYFTGSDVSLTNCLVTMNRAYGSGKNYATAWGGGIYVASGTVILDGCVVSGNRANGHPGTTTGSRGGGFYLQSGSLIISNSVVVNNEALGSETARVTGYGGGFFVAGGTLTAWNTLIYGNVARQLGYGYGLRVEGGSAALNNCTVASHSGDAVSRSAGTVALTNCILWGNTDDISGTGLALGYCDINDGDSNGVNGCFSADPLFQAGYYLDSASPCVNTGSMTAAAAGLASRTTRVDGQPDDGVVDLGYHYPSVVASLIADLYVAPDGDDGLNSGTNALSPFRTITKALATTTDGTRIHIAAGSYTNGSETFPLTLASRSGVQLLGTNCTTTVVNASGSGQRVLKLSSATGATRLEGLTLTGGNGGTAGGGLYLSACSDVAILSCVVSNNSVSGNGVNCYGGGIYATDSGARLTNTLVTMNSAAGYNNTYGNAYGAGIHLQNSTMVLGNSRVDRNTCSSARGAGYGGGPHLASGSLTISNSVIHGNTAQSYGGGVSAAGGTLTMVTVLVASNRSFAGGSDGIYAGGSSAAFLNCTIATNSAVGIGYAAGTISLTNCIVWGHTNADLAAWPASGGVLQNVGYSVLGGPPEMNGVNGCTVGDPMFVGAATNDFTLRKQSPAVNRGLTLAWMVSCSDLAGNARVFGDTVDIGAHESPYLRFTGTFISIR